jgi:hypothetical protein
VDDFFPYYRSQSLFYQTFSPAKVMFSGISVLLQVNVFLDHSSCIFVTTYQAANDVAASYDVLCEIFERIQAFLTRVKICSGIELTTEMTEMLGKIMAEVLCILTLSTKEIKQGLLSECLRLMRHSSLISLQKSF